MVDLDQIGIIHRLHHHKLVVLDYRLYKDYTALSLIYGYRGVAQLGARRVWDAEVDGSSPSTPTLYLTAGRPIHKSQSQRIINLLSSFDERKRLV